MHIMEYESLPSSVSLASRMICGLESLPTEIILIIFSHSSWDELLTSWWSVNKHLDAVICSMFFKDQIAITLHKRGLSFRQCSTRLLPTIHQSTALTDSIRRIHLDGRTSIAEEVLDQWFLHEQRVRFPHLTSLSLTRCWLSESVWNALSILVRDQLTSLRLGMDDDFCSLSAAFQPGKSADTVQLGLIVFLPQNQIEEAIRMFRQFIVQLFSDGSRLVSLQIDMHVLRYREHPWLETDSLLPASAMSDSSRSYCTTLRRLDIHLSYGSFLEHLIGHVPNLEQLTVTFGSSLQRHDRSRYQTEPPLPADGSWFDKVVCIIQPGSPLG